MLDLTRHPQLLWLQSFWDRAWGVLYRWREHETLVPDPLPGFHDQIWAEAARALEAEVRPLGCEAYEIVRDQARARIHGSATPFDDLATHRIVRYKATAYKLLTQHGLPTPHFTSFRLNDMQPAAAFLESIGGECVVKPGDGAGGGHGITTGIRTRWQLARAACAASIHGTDLLIEEQVPGDNYRLLYLDGQLLDAVLRRPPQVVGDGRSSILELVWAANRARPHLGPGRAHVPLTFDLELHSTLARQGYSYRSVPPPGCIVILKGVTNESSAAESFPARELLCPEIIEEGARAASALGVRLAGVDILAPAVDVPLSRSGGVVLEVSTCPGLFWHYYRSGPPCPVAIPILNALLARRLSRVIPLRPSSGAALP